jgi:hypothetical protein
MFLTLLFILFSLANLQLFRKNGKIVCVKRSFFSSIQIIQKKNEAELTLYMDVWV